jgi:hypothetical protein
VAAPSCDGPDRPTYFAREGSRQRPDFPEVSMRNDLVGRDRRGAGKIKSGGAKDRRHLPGVAEIARGRTTRLGCGRDGRADIARERYGCDPVLGVATDQV